MTMKHRIIPSPTPKASKHEAQRVYLPAQGANGDGTLTFGTFGTFGRGIRLYILGCCLVAFAFGLTIVNWLIAPSFTCHFMTTAVFFALTNRGALRFPWLVGFPLGLAQDFFANLPYGYNFSLWLLVGLVVLSRPSSLSKASLVKKWGVFSLCLCFIGLGQRYLLSLVPAYHHTTSIPPNDYFFFSLGISIWLFPLLYFLWSIIFLGPTPPCQPLGKSRHGAQ